MRPSSRHSKSRGEWCRHKVAVGLRHNNSRYVAPSTGGSASNERIAPSPTDLGVSAMQRVSTLRNLLLVSLVIALAAVSSFLFVLFGGSVPDYLIAQSTEDTKKKDQAALLRARMAQLVNL